MMMTKYILKIKVAAVIKVNHCGHFNPLAKESIN